MKTFLFLASVSIAVSAIAVNPPSLKNAAPSAPGSYAQSWLCWKDNECVLPWESKFSECQLQLNATTEVCNRVQAKQSYVVTCDATFMKVTHYRTNGDCVVMTLKRMASSPLLFSTSAFKVDLIFTCTAAQNRSFATA